MIGPLNGQPHGSFNNYRLGRKKRTPGMKRFREHRRRTPEWSGRIVKKTQGIFYIILEEWAFFVLSWKLWAFFIFLPKIFDVWFNWFTPG